MSREVLRDRIAEAIRESLETLARAIGVDGATLSREDLLRIADEAIDAAAEYMAPPF